MAKRNVFLTKDQEKLIQSLAISRETIWYRMNVMKLSFEDALTHKKTVRKRSLENYEIEFSDGRKVFIGNLYDLAARLNARPSRVCNIIKGRVEREPKWTIEDAITIPIGVKRKVKTKSDELKVFAAYKGDEYLGEGNLKELMQITNYSKSYLLKVMNGYYDKISEKGLSLIELED